MWTVMRTDGAPLSAQPEIAEMQRHMLELTKQNVELSKQNMELQKQVKAIHACVMGNSATITVMHAMMKRQGWGDVGGGAQGVS